MWDMEKCKLLSGTPTSCATYLSLHIFQRECCIFNVYFLTNAFCYFFAVEEEAYAQVSWLKFWRPAFAM